MNKMISRAALLSRRLVASSRSSSSTPSRTPLRLSRRYSSQRSQSATGDFYKTFTRPVAKCALLALFTYQVVYFAWAKLEQDEIKDERQAEIAKLEAQVESLQAAVKEEERPTEEPKVVKKGWWPF